MTVYGTNWPKPIRVRCSNCGKSVWDSACTMSHAMIRQELAVAIRIRAGLPPDVTR